MIVSSSFIYVRNEFRRGRGYLAAYRRVLREQGHDVVYVRDIGMQRAKDSEILELARSQDRIVRTFDLDFGDLLALGLNDKPSTIIFRLDDETAESVNTNLLTVLAQTESDLRDGALILVQEFRYRIRRLPIHLT